MARIDVQKERCKECGLCMAACPQKILSRSEELNAAGYHPMQCIDPKQCTGCAMCARTCPDVVITVYR